MKQSMARALVILGVVAGVSGAAYWYFHTQSGGQAILTRPAPEFALRDSGDRLHGLSSFKGKVVLLHFWAAWCPPCRDEMPEILQFARSFQDKDLRVISVSLDPRWSEAHTVLPQGSLPSNWISLLDPGQEVSEIYGSRQFPESYILSRDLRIVAKLVGAQAWNGPSLRTAILRELESQPPKDAK